MANKIFVVAGMSQKIIHYSLIVSCMIFFYTPPLLGQTSQKDMENLLTSNRKQWRWAQDSVWLSGQAKRGRYLLFTSLPKEAILISYNSKTKQRDSVRHRWKLHSNKEYNWLLTIGDSTFKLVIQETKHKLTLILRTRPSKGDMGDMTTDRIYEYIKPEQE